MTKPAFTFLLLAGLESLLANPGQDFAENSGGKRRVGRVWMTKVVREHHPFGRQKSVHRTFVLFELSTNCPLNEFVMFR